MQRVIELVLPWLFENSARIRENPAEGERGGGERERGVKGKREGGWRDGRWRGRGTRWNGSEDGRGPVQVAGATLRTGGWKVRRLS